MKRFFTLFGFLILAFICFSAEAMAQNENLDIIPQPICFSVRNTADFQVMGTVSSGFYVRPDGIRTRHRSDFRLKAAGDFDKKTGKPTDRADFCTSGPFLPGRKVELKLKTLFPVFTCHTRVDQGEILVKGVRRADNNGVEMSAACFE